MYAVRMKNPIWLALGLFAGNALADDGVIYRCTSSSSDVPTLQRTPCPTGSKQQVVRVPASAPPAPASATPVPAPPPPAPAPAPTRPPPNRPRPLRHPFPHPHLAAPVKGARSWKPAWSNAKAAI